MTLTSIRLTDLYEGVAEFDLFRRGALVLDLGIDAELVPGADDHGRDAARGPVVARAAATRPFQGGVIVEDFQSLELTDDLCSIICSSKYRQAESNRYYRMYCRLYEI